MNRFLIRAAAFIMMVMLVSAPAALADLERGDRGKDGLYVVHVFYQNFPKKTRRLTHFPNISHLCQEKA